MEEFIFSVILFLVIYLLYLFFIILRKKKLEQFMSGTEVTYLKRRYQLRFTDVKPKVLAHLIALSNSFIISVTFFIVTYIDNYILKLMVAFIILMPGIILMYHLIGIMFRKKESKHV